MFSCIANHFDTFGESCVIYLDTGTFLLVVAPSILHWLMFANALVCLLIFGQFLTNSSFFLLRICLLISIHFSSSSTIFSSDSLLLAALALSSCQ